jgi:hypothetical protein
MDFLIYISNINKDQETIVQKEAENTVQKETKNIKKESQVFRSEINFLHLYIASCLFHFTFILCSGFSLIYIFNVFRVRFVSYFEFLADVRAKQKTLFSALQQKSFASVSFHCVSLSFKPKMNCVF